MTDTEITTGRLVLRHVTPQDSERITTLVADPRIHRMFASVPPGQTRAQTLAWILTHDRGREADTNHVYALTREGQLIGIIGADRKETSLPFEIGYWLAPGAWGQGYCTEAGAALLGWLTATGRGRALVAGHFTDNPASGRVLSKLGFLPCGRDRRFSAGRGETADHIMMARIG